MFSIPFHGVMEFSIMDSFHGFPQKNLQIKPLYLMILFIVMGERNSPDDILERIRMARVLWETESQERDLLIKG